MPWLRWDSAFTEHPKTVQMDWRGRVYFWQLCSICKQNQFHGNVPSGYASALYISSKLPGIDQQAMATGKAQARSAGFTRDIEDGITEIVHWDEWQTDPTAAARQKAWRERQKEEKDRNALRNGETRDAVTRNDRQETRDLETRDKKEESKNPPNPPAGGVVSGKAVRVKGTRKPRHRAAQAYFAAAKTDEELDDGYAELCRYDKDEADKRLKELAHSGNAWAKRKMMEAM